MNIRRRKTTVTPIVEMNDLLTAAKPDREQLISEMSESVAKALLLYYVNRWINRE
jgi:hypothetical protein